MTKSDFSKMCEPAKLYLLVSVVALVYGIFQRFSMITLGTNFIFAVLWTMVLNWLCSIGMKTLSWILVLLPYLMLFLSAGFVMDMMHSKEGFQHNIAKKKDTSAAKTADPIAAKSEAEKLGAASNSLLDNPAINRNARIPENYLKYPGMYTSGVVMNGISSIKHYNKNPTNDELKQACMNANRGVASSDMIDCDFLNYDFLRKRLYGDR